MGIEISTINSIQPARIMKAKNLKAETQPQQEGSTNPLSNPMETVGRSQVNFKSRLSVEDLNTIAYAISKSNLDLSKTETRICKNVLGSLMEKYNCKNIKQFNEYREQNSDQYADVYMSFINKVLEIAPNANLDKLSKFALIF